MTLCWISTLIIRSSQMIPSIVNEHLSEVASLWMMRSSAITVANVGLEELARHDARMVAHLDGIRVALADGVVPMGTDDGGEIFAGSIVALERREIDRLEKIIKKARDSSYAYLGFTSAMGWVSAQYLQGYVASLLLSPESFKVRIGLATCFAHRVSPGTALVLMQDSEPELTSAVFQSAAEFGHRELMDVASNYLSSEDQGVRFSACWYLFMCGDRGRGMSVLRQYADELNGDSEMAMSLLLRASPLDHAHDFLRDLAHRAESLPKLWRRLIWGCGVAGDSHYVPWLIDRMSDSSLARRAGEAFSMVTGLDLWQPPFFRPPPEETSSGACEDPDNENVALDQDEGLPWPDQTAVSQWWQANEAKFPAGKRVFMGKPITREHCIYVLRNGYQRQRMAAAQYLCLLQPGTPLFNTAAPAWRQQRWLAQMG